MRKSNNYYKFLNYVSAGNWYTSTICKDNGVLECKSYLRVSDLEGYSKLYHCAYEKTILNSDTELTLKNVLVNYEVIYIYYLTDVGEVLLDAFILDNYNTQKELKDEIKKRVVEFFLNNESFCEHKEATEDYNEEPTEDSSEYKEISDRKESTDRDRINYLMETHSFPSISGMYNDKCFWCPADRKGNECKGREICGKTWKRYEAITNPEWHHVSLATLANLNFDMLDRKRQVYLKAHRELKRTLSDLSKCKSCHAYEVRARKFFRDMKSKYYRNVISHEMRKYLDLQISMSNVINGVWCSYVEPATGCYESRRYSRTTLPH